MGADEIQENIIEELINRLEAIELKLDTVVDQNTQLQRTINELHFNTAPSPFRALSKSPRGSSSPKLSAGDRVRISNPNTKIGQSSEGTIIKGRTIGGSFRLELTSGHKTSRLSKFISIIEE